MSYFICGFNIERNIKKSFEEVFVDIIPSDLRNPIISIENDKEFITVYGKRKVIKDILIENDKQGSWLVILGTPLLYLNSIQQKKSFLEEFFTNPDYSLKQKIDGNFILFGYNSQTKEYFAATDFNCTHPVFYKEQSKGYIFSSHELALAKYTNPDVDPFGFAQSINLGITWGTQTRFKKIYKMMPCSLFVYNEKRKRERYYWKPTDETLWSGKLNNMIEMWGTSLRETVWKYYECSGHNPVINDFTAGEDSRLLLAQCHSLKIPFKATVTGPDDDIDVIVAKKAAKKIGFTLMERKREWIDEEQLLDNAIIISLNGDAYHTFFKSCVEFATNIANQLDDYSFVKFNGVPGGSAFRGAHYLRGKAVFPSKKSSLDFKFFTRMKYLLDFHPGLLNFSDDEFLRNVYEIVETTLKDVNDYPIGTQIDHMVRIFQTSFLGHIYKNPLYLPLATSKMTRSIYCLPPKYKQGGRLTRAYTELLFPELAIIKTQNGVPTIRRTLARSHLFFPEYISQIKRISNGAMSRLFKWSQSKKWYFNIELNAPIIITLLNKPPYCNWFSSSKSMLTGNLYNSDQLNSMLNESKKGISKRTRILGNIINQELAFRWIYREI
jgi:hypothetical protein